MYIINVYQRFWIKFKNQISNLTRYHSKKEIGDFMINLYVDMQNATKTGKRIIEINDIEFEERVSKDNITELDKQFMCQIDKVSETNGDFILTPFGATDLYHLSTGCKTIININHILNQIGYTDYPIVDITECGENVIELIFNLIDNTTIEVILMHSFIVSLVDKGYVFNVIGEKVVDSIYELSTLIDGR